MRPSSGAPVGDAFERQRASEAAPRGLWSAWSMKSMISRFSLSALLPLPYRLQSLSASVHA
jgi:hypothetical protein